MLREDPGADEYARATYLMPDLTSLDRSRSQSFVRQQTRRLDPQLYVGQGGRTEGRAKDRGHRGRRARNENTNQFNLKLL